MSGAVRSAGGPHQRRNAAVAQGLLTALPPPYRPTATQIERAFGLARVAGRLDQRGRWLFDVAHNPDGMRSLVRALAATRPRRPLHALVSILGDKEWPEMLVQLDQAIDRGVLTIAPTAAARGWDIEWLRRWLKDPDRPPAHAEWTLIPDFAEAVEKVQEDAGTVFVTGSFHTVGDVMSSCREWTFRSRCHPDPERNVGEGAELIRPSRPIGVPGPSPRLHGRTTGGVLARWSLRSSG